MFFCIGKIEQNSGIKRAVLLSNFPYKVCNLVVDLNRLDLWDRETMGDTSKDTKEYKVLVEKENKLLVLVALLTIFCVSAGVGAELQEAYPHLDVNFWIPCISLILLVILGFLLDKFVDFKETITVIFQEGQVVLKRKNKERIINYSDIKKVVKTMLFNRTYQDKGKYRVVIKCKGRNYVMYSGEDYDLKLDFKQTEVSKVYYELKNRGIMCC